MSDNSKASELIRGFMSDYKLTLCSDVISPNCNYTYIHETLQVTSFIDYFLFSTNSINNLLQFRVLDDLVNMSDHLPVLMSATLSVAVPRPMDNSAKSIRHAQEIRLRWDRANVASYYSHCYSSMLPLMCDMDNFYSQYLPLASVNAHCQAGNGYDEPIMLTRNRVVTARPAAIEFIESIYERFTTNLCEAANRTIPKMGRSTLKHWWNEELQILKQSAWESHNAWLVAGKPLSGLLAEVRKKDKYAYKLCIKKFKRAGSDGISNSLYETLVNKDSNSFWQVWRSKVGTPRSLPKSVNGECDQQVIADSFAKYFHSACSNNSVVRSQELYSEFCAMKRGYNQTVN